MKTLILIFTLSIISMITTAQNTNENIKQNEIGITLLSFKNNFSQEYKRIGLYHLSYFSGIDYKRHFGNNAMRLGIDYRNRKQIEGSNKYQEVRSRIGYQRTFGNKTIKPYVAFDLTMINSKDYENSEGGFTDYQYYRDLKYFGIGFAPAIGLNIKLTETLSLTAEANLEFLWINKNGAVVYGTNSRQDTPIKIKQYVIRRNPLNIVSLNYKL